MGKQHRQDHGQLLRLADNDRLARQEGPKQKNWHLHDLLEVTARNARQRAAFDARARGQHLALLGTAGTGKTFLALLMALQDMLNPENDIDHVVIVRSAVQGREQGFLPGTAEEKLDPFTRAYREMLDELFPKYRNNYDNMIETGKLVVDSTSFLRGTTMRRAALVVDEIQNCTDSEINTVITRGAPRVYITGDTAQVDLAERIESSGLPMLYACLKYMPSITAIEFKQQDIIRKGLTREYIIARERAAEAAAHARATQSNPIPQPQPLARAAA